jgi:hypothetical protein
MILTAAGTRRVARTYCEIHEFNAPARWARPGLSTSSQDWTACTRIHG